jgi:hypothetical protein
VPGVENRRAPGPPKQPTEGKKGTPRMAHREPLDEQEPTIGKLVVDAFADFGALVRSFIELAKSELRVSVRAGGMAVALFLVAGFISLLAIIMLSIAIAFFIHMADLDLAWCFLIVFGAYLLVAALLGFIGYRKVRKVRAPERTKAQASDTPKALMHKG